MLQTAKEIRRHGYLLKQLVRKEIKLRYKRSSLGFLWSLLHPLLMMLVFTLVFTRFPKFSDMPVPFYVFFLTGFLPWTYFSTTVANSHTSIIANYSLVKQVYFPRQLLPLASCISNLFHFAIAFGMWLVFLCIFQDAFTWRLVLIPVAVGIQMVLLLGLALLLSAMNVSFRDVGQILEVFLTFLFYLTPVFYSYSFFPESDAWLIRILGLNPLAQIVMLYRGILLDGFAITPFMLWYPTAFSFGLLVIGHLYFRRASRTFAKEL